MVQLIAGIFSAAIFAGIWAAIIVQAVNRWRCERRRSALRNWHGQC